jgi:hypothetical protein
MWNMSIIWWEFIIRGIIIYLFLIIILRLTGKRQVGQMSPFDLVLLLVLSNAVQNSMSGGDNSIIGGMILASFCSDIPSKPGHAGFFRSIIASKKVSGRILTTISAKDTAVGRYYPIAAGARGDVQFAPGTFPKFGVVGSFGARGPGLNIVDLDMQAANYPYQFAPGHIYNIESTRYICEGGGTSGAHNDIAKPEVAHAFWSSVI